MKIEVKRSLSKMEKEIERHLIERIIAFEIERILLKIDRKM